MTPPLPKSTLKNTAQYFRILLLLFFFIFTHSNTVYAAAPAGEWWNASYGYRQKITVTTDATPPVNRYNGYTALRTMDTATLVTATKMQNDCDDLRVLWWNGSAWVELDRDIVNCNNASTEVWFKLQADIAGDPGSDDNYYFYYGNGGAVAGPADRNNVYIYYDDFESYGIGTLPTGWTLLVGNASVQNDGGDKALRMDSASNNTRINLRYDISPAERDILVEADCNIDPSVAAGYCGVGSRWSGTNAADETGYMGEIRYNTDQNITQRYLSGAWTGIGSSNEAVTRGTYYRVRLTTVGANPTTIKMYRDGVLKLNNTNSDIDIADMLGIDAFNSQTNDYEFMDNYLARRFIEPEPTAAAAAEEAPVIISGTVYTDEGTTNIGAGKTVRLLINGSSVGTSASNGSGQYSISTTVNAGDALVLYIDGDDGATDDATTVTVSDGATLAGLDLYRDHLIVRHDNAGVLSNALLNTAKGAYSDTEILYSVTAGNLTISGASTELYIPASHSFTPGGNVTTPLMKSLGTFTGGSGSIDINGALTIGGGTYTATSGTTFVSGNFTLSGGTFNHNSGTVSLEPNNKTVNTGAAVFNHVIVNMFNGETLTVTGSMDVDGNLTISGVAAINGTISVAGNVTTTTFVSGAGIILLDGNTNQTLGASGGVGGISGLTINNTGGPGAVVTIQDTIDVGGSGAWTYTAGNVDASTSTIRFREFSKTISPGSVSFSDVEFNLGSGSTVTLSGTMDIDGNLTFTEQGTINGGGINLAGNLSSTDASVNGTTTLTLDGTGAQTISASGADFPDGLFAINKTSGTAQLLANFTTALDGAGQDLTITSGTLDLNSFNLTVPDVLTVAASGTLQLEGGETVTTTSSTLNTGSTILYDGGGSYTGLEIGNTYANLTFNGIGSWTLDAALDVNENLTITSGTLDVSASNYSVNVAGNWSNTGTFTARSGTVVLDGTNQSISGSTTFNNLSKTESTNDATDVTLTFDNTATQTINGTLTLDGLDADDRINLVSDSPGTQWSLNLGASAVKTIDFVDVTDSDASGSDAGQKPINPSSSINSGNNLDWFNTCPIVTTTANAGDGSLRDCITYANSNPGSTISFNIPNSDPGYIDNAGDDWWRISPTSALPGITGANTVIDGSTQTSNQGNTNTLGPEIELDGTNAGSSNGITINNAVNTTLRNLVINNFTLHGVSVSGISATGATLYGNYIGIDPTATGNAQNDDSGISIDSANAVIGGTASGEGNLIAFNFERGILISINSAGTSIIGNEIREQGFSGILSLASGVEISKNLIRNNSSRTNFDEISISTNNIVTNNTIHGSADDGVSVEGANAIIKNNIITGSAGYGIRIDGGSMTEDYNNVPASPTSNGNALGSCFGCGGLGANSIASDPAYVNVGANNFNLTEPSSPAIEAACNLGNAGDDTACDTASDGAQPDLNGATAGNFNGAAPDMGAFESNTSILPLVKVLYQGDTCLASSDADAACNGGATSISVPTGVLYTFVIYVSNPTGSAVTDIRFQDNIDDAAADFFEFQANAFAAGQGIQWATTGSGTSTKAQIKAALNAGTALTNAFDGSTGTNEYCGINTGVSPDQLVCGGDAASPNNDQVDVAASDTFAIMFDFIKRD